MVKRYVDLLGRIVTLPILRFGPPGAFLAADEGNAGPREGKAETILLPGSEVPEGKAIGDELLVFIYLDSEDRPVATARSPKLALGEVAFLEITTLTNFGAFANWGLPKELLIPFSEQTRDLHVGERYPIGLYLDDTERLAGTMRVSEMLRDCGEFERDEWVSGEAWRKEPGMGVFVIVEQRFVGLLPESEPHTLGRGETGRFRVARVLSDGKIELSLRGHAHEELEKDARTILETLARPGTPGVGDHSSPEEIRALFGLSKKAFKRAVGHLLKTSALSLDSRGFLVRTGR